MPTMQSGSSRVLVTGHEARLARDVLEQLEGPKGVLAVERDGHRADAVPAEIGRLLQQVLSVMARGGTVTIGSVPDASSSSSTSTLPGHWRERSQTL